MENLVFDRIVDELVKLDYRNTISLSLYNEPLCDTNLLDRIAIIREKLPFAYIRFNSNGDYLTEEYIDKLSASGTKEMQITVHFGSDEQWDDGLAEKKVRGFFERLNIPYEIKSVIPGHNVTTDIIYKGIRILVLANNWEQDGNSRGGIVEHLNCDNRMAPCSNPFREIAIDIDGNFRQCCNIYVTAKPIANVKEVSLVDFFLSDEMNALRRELLVFSDKANSACRTCNTFDYSMKYKEEEWNERWKSYGKC